DRGLRGRSPVTVAGPPRTRTGFLHCRSAAMLSHSARPRQTPAPTAGACHAHLGAAAGMPAMSVTSLREAMDTSIGDGHDPAVRGRVGEGGEDAGGQVGAGDGAAAG